MQYLVAELARASSSRTARRNLKVPVPGTFHSRVHGISYALCLSVRTPAGKPCGDCSTSYSMECLHSPILLARSGSAMYSSIDEPSMLLCMIRQSVFGVSEVTGQHSTRCHAAVLLVLSLRVPTPGHVPITPIHAFAIGSHARALHTARNWLSACPVQRS